jgi:hypothetical protein
MRAPLQLCGRRVHEPNKHALHGDRFNSTAIVSRVLLPTVTPARKHSLLPQHFVRTVARTEKKIFHHLTSSDVDATRHAATAAEKAEWSLSRSPAHPTIHSACPSRHNARAPAATAATVDATTHPDTWLRVLAEKQQAYVPSDTLSTP